MNVLITGGTGSVGKVIANLVLRRPEVKKVMVYSRDEHKQERMFRDFSRNENNNKLRFFIGDVRDKSRLITAMRDATHVVHTAALKIVPAMEYNPMEAVKTNVLGTQNVLEAAGECGVTNHITLSTDKAVSPINLYGASKLVAEKLTIASNSVYPDTNFNVVRYGNVAMSAGSVIPLFHNWCCDKQPLEITNMDMTRFWITLEEAAEFVVDRLFDPKPIVPEHRGCIYIPEMPSYRMWELVDIFSTKGVENKIIGIRPGEKIHEQIITYSELERAKKKEDYIIVYPDRMGPKQYINASDKEVFLSTQSNTARFMTPKELKQRINKLL